MFDHPEFQSHQQVHFLSDAATGLKAIIAIHDARGTAAGGGIRFFPYASADEALSDVLRLSRAMTLKSVLAGLPFGGAKAVIIGNPATLKTEALLEAFGRCVESLGGQYVCAEDIGMTPADMAVIARSTKHAVGLPGRSGDTSPATGRGVYRALLAAASHRLGRKPRSVGILGFGNVGRHLARHLRDCGVALHVADINQVNVEWAVREFGAAAVSTADFFSLDVDALAPCSIGGVLDDQTIARIVAPIVCGGANNQLKDPARHAELLHARRILFVPDYLANAGGLISGSADVTGRDAAATQAMVEAIHDTCARVFALAERDGTPPLVAAERLACL